MEEIEDHTEKVQEDLHEKAHEAREPWVGTVALAAAIIAALAAVTSLQAGHHANEAMMEQMKASDDWNYYQAKSIKAAELSHHLDTMQLLAALHADGAQGEKAGPAEAAGESGESLKEKREKLAEYRKNQKEIREKAEEEEKGSAHHMGQHTKLAHGVTMFQVAIAVAAICVLTRKFGYFLVTLVFAAAGIVFLIMGLLA